jgi:c-di-GMP-binding flagellar brake protein YcgR
MAQRRNFARLGKRLEVEYKLIIDKFASTAQSPSTTFTDSISGNGMSMYIPKPMEKGKTLELTIKLPTGKIEMAGEVIGNKTISENQFEIIVKFIQIDESERDKLVKYVTREGVKVKQKK